MVDPRNAPLVSIIVVNWNRKDDTLRCIESLRRLDYPNFEVIVVDNGSEDGSVESLSQLRDIELVQLSRNTGFTGGHIAGLERSNGEFVALINNDMVVGDRWLTALVDASQSYGADIVGGRDYRWNDAEPAFDTSNTYWSYMTVDPVVGGARLVERGDRATSVNALLGSNLLVSRRVIERVGYLDDTFFAYFEEVDFVARAKRAGFKTFYEPKAHVWHRRAASSSAESNFQLDLAQRNRVRFVIKNYDRKYLLKFLVIHHVEIVSAMLKRGAKSDVEAAMIRGYKANLRALPHLLRERRNISRLGPSYIEKILARGEGFDEVTAVVLCGTDSSHITDTLDSLAAQALPPAEIVLVDDNATQDLTDRVDAYVQKRPAEPKFPAHRVIENVSPKSEGPKDPLLSEIQTDWVVFLDAGDALDPDYLHRCVRAARVELSVVVYTDIEEFGERVSVRKAGRINSRTVLSDGCIDRTALIRTDLYRQAGGRTEGQGADRGFNDLFAAISRISKRFSYVPEPLHRRRITSVTHT